MAPNDIPERRRRAQRGKSRRGCQQCKALRIKCDETRPTCRNCEKKGLVCPGYLTLLRWQNNHAQKRTVQKHAEQIGDTSFAQPQPVDLSSTEPGTAIIRPQTPLSDLGLESERAIPSLGCSDLDWLNESNDDVFADQEISGLASDLAAVNAYPWQDDNTFRISPVQAPSTCVTPHPLTRSLVDLPTTMIEYWFSSVCPIWSAFDSEVNYNRQLASAKWSVSGAVFFTLQAMSAAHLGSSMPRTKYLLPSLLTQATVQIESELNKARSLADTKTDVGLVFAVFAFGSTMHWTSAAIDHLWPSHARILLKNWESATIPPTEAYIYAYFSQALVYWEMLLHAAHSSFQHAKLLQRQLRYKVKIRAAIQPYDRDVVPDNSAGCEPPAILGGTRPNSWCGMSSEVVELFGEVLSLCRSARSRQLGNIAIQLAESCDAICDMAVARDLQTELIAMDFGKTIILDQLLGFQTDTQDEATPISHLLQTAEAYRQAALLQLYLTFTDIDILPIPAAEYLNNTRTTSPLHSSPSSSGSRSQEILAFAVQLVKTLQGIPVESGSRSIHPILYLSAATGLRYGAGTEPQSPVDFTGMPAVRFQGPRTACNAQTANAHSPSILTPLDLSHFTQAIPSLYQPEAVPFPQEFTISQISLEVARARNFICTRISALQYILPSRPLGILMDLVKAIWNAYDNDSSELSNVHWLDIMADSGLQTMFG